MEKEEVWKILVEYIEARRDVELGIVDKRRLRKEFEDWFEQIHFEGFETRSLVAVFKVVINFANSFNINNSKGEEEKMTELLLDDAEEMIDLRTRGEQGERSLGSGEIRSHLQRFLSTTDLSGKDYLELRHELIRELDFIENSDITDKTKLLTENLEDIIEEVKQSEKEELYISHEATVTYIQNNFPYGSIWNQNYSDLRRLLKKEIRTFRQDQHQEIKDIVEEILESDGKDLNISHEEMASFINDVLRDHAFITEWYEDSEQRERLKEEIREFVKYKRQEKKREQQQKLLKISEIVLGFISTPIFLYSVINGLGIELTLLDPILTPVISILTNPGFLVGTVGVLVTLGIHFWEPPATEAMLEETEKELNERIEEQNKILSDIRSKL